MIMTEPVLNQNHLTFDEVRKNQAVRTLSRLTPISTNERKEEEKEPLDVLLARSEKVAEGMQTVLQKEFNSV
jgi:hypothetical protein